MITHTGIGEKKGGMMRYGTMFRVRLRPDATEDQLRGFLERWQRGPSSRFPGSTHDLLMKVESAVSEGLRLLNMAPLLCQTIARLGARISAL
jgi:hypothetical protein